MKPTLSDRAKAFYRANRASCITWIVLLVLLALFTAPILLIMLREAL